MNFLKMRIPAPFILRKSLLLTIVAILLATAGQAAIVGTYSFTTGLDVTSQVEGVDFDSLTGSNITLVGWTYSRSWTTSSAIDLTYYISLKLRPEIGYQLSLTQLSGSFSIASRGPPHVSAAIFVDNILQQQFDSYEVGAAPALIVFDFSDLFGIQASNEVEFRIYAWSATHPNGQLLLDDLTVSGEVTAVPEPASYAAFAGVFALFGAMWRRRGRVTHGI